MPKICSGAEIVGIGLTEPHAGSDAGMPQLQAVRDGDDWVLNGSKSLSFGRDAAAVVVVVVVVVLPATSPPCASSAASARRSRGRSSARPGAGSPA